MRPDQQTSVHAAAVIFAGMFGSYSCYNDLFSMRLEDIEAQNSLGDDPQRPIDIGKSDNSRYGTETVYRLRFHQPTIQYPQGKLVLSCAHFLQRIETSVDVWHEGVLSYFQEYVERLESGVYKTASIVPQTPVTRGIELYPDSGDHVSCVVTRGIEVKASARWFPNPGDRFDRGLNFGYSIRIRMIPTERPQANPNDATAAVGRSAASGGSTTPTTCQLVSRHWQFMDGNGSVRRVDGEAVIGKQPLFYQNRDGTTGYIDLGDAGRGDRHDNETFYYQSQSGPVAGTSQSGTGQASVRGYFGFVPGSIENPTGPIFQVQVAQFPLTIPSPFY